MIDIGWCEFVQALMVAAVVVILDEGSDLALEVAWQVIVFEQIRFFSV